MLYVDLISFLLIILMMIFNLLYYLLKNYLRHKNPYLEKLFRNMKKNKFLMFAGLIFIFSVAQYLIHINHPVELLIENSQ